MDTETILWILRIVAVLSLGTVLSFIAIRHTQPIRKSLIKTVKVAKDLTDSYTENQKVNFERTNRLVYKKKGGLIYNINLNILRSGLMDKVPGVNARSVMIISILLYILSLSLVKGLTDNAIIAFYSSFIVLAAPLITISTITEFRTADKEKYMLYNMETLIQFVSTDKGNILEGYKQALPYLKPKAFRDDTAKFLFNVQVLQMDFSEAVRIYKNLVNIRTYGYLLDSLSQCSKTGGDYTTLLNHYTERLTNLQKAKINRLISSMGTRIAIYLLVAINIAFFFLLRHKSESGYLLVTQNFGLMSLVFIFMFVVLIMGINAGRMKL